MDYSVEVEMNECSCNMSSDVISYKPLNHEYAINSKILKHKAEWKSNYRKTTPYCITYMQLKTQ